MMISGRDQCRLFINQIYHSSYLPPLWFLPLSVLSPWLSPRTRRTHRRLSLRPHWSRQYWKTRSRKSCQIWRRPSAFMPQSGRWSCCHPCRKSGRLRKRSVSDLETKSKIMRESLNCIYIIDGNEWGMGYMAWVQTDFHSLSIVPLNGFLFVMGIQLSVRNQP